MGCRSSHSRNSARVIGLCRARFMEASVYHELGMDATERHRRRGGSGSTGAKGGLDVADNVVERREPRSRRGSRGGAKIGAPVGFAPAGGVRAFSVASRGSPLAIDDQIGREPRGRKLAYGKIAREVGRGHGARSLSRVSTPLTTATTAARAASSDFASGPPGTRRVSLSWASRTAADTAPCGESKRRCRPIGTARLGQRLPKRMKPARSHESDVSHGYAPLERGGRRCRARVRRGGGLRALRKPADLAAGAGAPASARATRP